MMNNALKNPVVLFFAGILALWLAFYALKIVVNLFWLILLVFAVLFVVNPQFRGILQRFFNVLFK